MHINIVPGDYVFNDTNETAWKEYNKCVLTLRKQGYRKINQEYDWLNMYEHYRQKGKKEVITVTMMLS